MKNRLNQKVTTLFLALLVSATFSDAKTISGKVTNAKGKAMEGVMLSAFTKDFNQIKTISVFTQANEIGRAHV